jgi:hypothetical protein
VAEQQDKKPSSNAKLPRTLEECVAGEDFGRRGWQRLIEVTDYLAHLVDGRTTGVFATESRDTYLRVLSLATTVKAALQWFALDDSPRPRFVVEAEKYLGEGSADGWIRSPLYLPDDEQRALRTGPVVPRKGGRGRAGRLHALTELKRRLVELMQPLTQEDLHRHQSALRASELPAPKEGWILARALGDIIFFALVEGTCSDLLREQGFQWPTWDDVRFSLDLVMENVLDDADIGLEPATTRDDRLNELAERLVRAALMALGVRVDKDLFRERRER